MSVAPTFLDRFIIHLVTKLLLDVNQVEEWLRDAVATAATNTTNASRPSRRLYWRSQLVNDKPTISSSQDGDLSEALSFVDLTFDVVTMATTTNDEAGSSTTSTPENHATAALAQLQIRIGYFLQSTPSPLKARYVQSKPLTQVQLEAHAQSIGIDVFSGPPQAMATMMAQALHSLGSSSGPSTTTLDGTCVVRATEKTLVDKTLYYSDVQERGTFGLPIGSISEFDTVGMNLLYFNILRAQESPQGRTNPSSTPKDATPTLDTSDEVLIERRLQECWDQLSSITATSASNLESSSSLTAYPLPLSTASNSSAATGIKRTASIGDSISKGKAYVAVNKRKKKGKLMYAKPS